MNKIYKASDYHVINIAELEKQSFSSPLSEQNLKILLKSDVFDIYVFESDNAFCGYCITYTILGETEITSFAISSIYRQKGLGFLFLKDIIETLKNKNVEHIFLEVRVSNQKAFNLYKKVGFQIDRIREGFYEKPKEDAYAMSLHL